MKNSFAFDVMPIPSRRIVLFYKNLICPGGAERLFAKEYQHLSALGYEVFVVTNRLEPQALFGVSIPHSALIVLGKSGTTAILELARTLRRLGNPPVVCSSGHLDIFLASLLGGFDYALHIHHPCFMSLNDYDKYSVLMRRHFERYTRSNFGASRFLEIRRSLTLWQWVDMNLRALLSIASKRRSHCSFVLSRFARQEKRDLYGIDTVVLYGALDDDFKVSVHQRGSSDVFTLLTVARLDINKRIDELIRAVALLVEKGCKIRLLIVGDGPEKSALEELVRSLKLADSIDLLGFIPDEQLPGIYADADLFVSIDWADFKITMFESLARGLPVLVSDETECDDRLVELGYVSLVQPVAESVANAISQSMSKSVVVLPERASPILQGYTWGRYFQKIALALSQAGLLIPPAQISASNQTQGVSD